MVWKELIRSVSLMQITLAWKVVLGKHGYLLLMGKHLQTVFLLIRQHLSVFWMEPSLLILGATCWMETSLLLSASLRKEGMWVTSSLALALEAMLGQLHEATEKLEIAQAPLLTIVKAGPVLQDSGESLEIQGH